MRVLTVKLLRDVLRLRGQLLAVTAVLACGIATLVTMHGTYESLLVSQRVYYERCRFADVFAHVKRAPESVALDIERLPDVSAVQTRIVFDVTLDVPGLDEPATGRLVSVPEKHRPVLNDLFLRQGRYVEPGRTDEVIVSEAFAEANGLRLDDTIAALLNGRRRRLRVVGIAISPEYIYEVRGGADFLPDNRRFGVLWMGRESLGPVFDLENAFNDLSISLRPGVREEVVINELDRLLSPHGGLGAYGRADQTSHRFISDEISQNRTQAFIIPPVFLAVSVFLLHIVLSRLVGTQRDEIAVLKAFGYRNSTVGAYYLMLSLTAVTLGAAVGILGGWRFGYELTKVYAQFYRFPVLSYETGAAQVAVALAAAFVTAVTASLGAVRRVVALPPAEAMRPEPPPTFRPLFIERLGFHAWLSPAVRMILRNLERRPFKAFWSAFGISTAVALLLIGLFFFDTILFLLDVQFNIVQREDVTVVFTEPRPADIGLDLNRLPGVLRTETFRVAPVRVRNGHRSRRIALFGTDADADLRRPVGADLHPVDVPPEGVVLTTYLAEILDVRPGMTLTVEILEGRRETRAVAVVGVVDELIGLSGYMNRQSLSRLLKESGTVSGAHLLIDSSRASEIYRTLKEMPAVSGISIRKASIVSFQETMAKSLWISTSVLVSFACVIVFGMVYNGARVALSERGRELASLRVLGFTLGEIAFMLLGEQAVLTLAAVPLGFVIGYWATLALVSRLQTELFRLPPVISLESWFYAFCVVAVSALVSGLAVRRRLERLDLVAVLKTRE